MNNFCMRDGTAFDAQGICPECGNTRAAQVAGQPAQPQYAPQSQYGYAPQPQYVQQPYAPQPGYVPQPPMSCPPTYQPAVRTQPTLISVCWDYVKAFFSRDPMNSVRNAALCSRPIWLILGLGGMLLVALGIFAATGFKFSDYADENGMYALLSVIAMFFFGGEPDLDLGFEALENLVELSCNGAAVFFLGLAVLLVVFFLNSVTLRMVFATGGQRVAMTQVLNLQAASMLPVIVASLAALILTFVSPLLAVVVLAIGAIIATVQQYFGIQKAAAFTASPLWAFAFKLLLDAAGVFLVLLLIALLA